MDRVRRELYMPVFFAFLAGAVCEQHDAGAMTGRESEAGGEIACSTPVPPVRGQAEGNAAPRGEKDDAAPRGKPIDYLRDPPLRLPDFDPAEGQESLDGILAAVGENVSSLFANLFNISAVETVQQQKLDDGEAAGDGRKFECLYLCIGALGRNDASFEEYRTDKRGHETVQPGLDGGYMLTSGFVSAPLVFHPVHRSGSAFRLLGRQKFMGRDAIVLAFAQIPARSRLSGSFQTGRNIEAIFKQGMVWVDARDYQILRLVSDLLTPLPRVRLERVETRIDFEEVPFEQKATSFRLPVRVVVTVNWNGKVFRNTHAYSDFLRFSVETRQKVRGPSGSVQTEGATGSVREKGGADSSPQSTSPRQ